MQLTPHQKGRKPKPGSCISYHKVWSWHGILTLMWEEIIWPSEETEGAFNLTSYLSTWRFGGTRCPCSNVHHPSTQEDSRWLSLQPISAPGNSMQVALLAVTENFVYIEIFTEF
jgi:hypothetical protein